MVGTNPSRAGGNQVAKERERILERLLAGERAAGLGSNDVFEIVTAPRGYSQSTNDALSSAGHSPADLAVLSGSYTGPDNMASIFEQGLVDDDLRRQLLGTIESALGRDTSGIPFDGNVLASDREDEQDALLRAAGYKPPRPELTPAQRAAAARMGYEPPSESGSSNGSQLDAIIERYGGGSPSDNAPDASERAGANVAGQGGTLETAETSGIGSDFWSRITGAVSSWFNDDEAGTLAEGVRAGRERGSVTEQQGLRQGGAPQAAGLYPPLDDQMASIVRDGVRPGSEAQVESQLGVQSDIDGLQTTRDRAAQLGVEDPTDDQGALSWLLESLQRPQSALVGGLTGFLGMDVQDDEVDQGPVQRGLSRAAEGYMADAADQYDFSDISGLETSEMDTWYGKAGAASTNFIGNVFTDPTTYVTMGGGGMARRAASEGAERSVRAAAARAGKDDLGALAVDAQERLLQNVGDEATFSTRVARMVEQFTDVGTGGRGAAGRKVVGVSPDDVSAALNNGETRAGVLEAFEKLGMDPAVRRGLLGDGLENLAGGAYQRGGATAMARQLESVFGSGGDDVFRALDPSLRGGIQITVPFASRSAEFGRASVGRQVTAGGGTGTITGKGGQAAADLYNMTRRYVTTSPVGRGWQSVFGGKNATELKAVSRALHEGSEELAGVAWSQFRAARDAKLVSGEVANAMSSKNRQAFVTVARHLQGVEREGLDPADAKEAMALHMHARGSKSFDPHSGRQLLPDGSLGDKVVERGLNDLDPRVVQAGADAEQQMYSTMHEMAERLRATARSDDEAMSLLNHYTPRRITDEVDFEKGAKRSRSGKTNHAKGRTGVYAIWQRDPVTGELSIESFMSPAEQAAKAGVRGDTYNFAQDPTELMADYVGSLERAVDTQTALRVLDDAGMFTMPKSAGTVQYDERGLSDTLAPAAEAINKARQTAQTAGVYARSGDGDRARDMLGDVVDVLGEGEAQKLLDAMPEASILQKTSDGKTRFEVKLDGRTTVHKTLEDAIGFADRETLSSAYDTISDAVLARTLTDNAAVDQLLDVRNMPYDDPEALAAHIESLTSVVGRWTGQSRRATEQSLQTRRKVASQYQRRITESGEWEALSEAGKDAFALRSLAESGAFAPSQIVESLGRQYRAQHRQPELAAVMDKVWQPYFTSFKATATVGRGPGFAIRNALGGTWNAYLAGATQSHFRTSERMMRYEAAAKRKVFAELRESGKVLPPDELTTRVKDAVRAEFEAKFKPEKGARLFDALEAFYDRNLMGGSRTDEYKLQTGKGLGGASGSMSRYAGGPGGAGLDGDPMDQMSRWDWLMKRNMPTRGSQVDAMDPGLARGAGLSNTVFADKQRSDLGWFGKSVQAVSDNPWVRANSELAEKSEQYVRLAPFLSGLDRFGLEDGGRAAALGVKASQFDYGDLSEVERRYLRNLMPFYTFTRNNIPLQIRAAMSSPDKMAKLGHGWDATQDAFGEDERWDESLFPRWVRENLGFATSVSASDAPGASLLARVPVLGRMFESDARISANLSSLPTVDLEKLTSSPRDEFVSMLNPMLKVPIELGLNIDTFTRGEPPATERLPDALQWGWLDVLPGIEQSADGVVSAARAPLHAARQMVPPVGQVERLLGSTERYEDRMATSWASNLAGAPVSSLDDFQIGGQARRSQQELSQEITRTLGREIDRQAVYKAIDELGAEVVRQAMEAGQLPQLLTELEAAQ